MSRGSMAVGQTQSKTLKILTMTDRIYIFLTSTCYIKVTLKGFYLCWRIKIRANIYVVLNLL